MTTIDQKLNVRAEIEQAVAKDCNYIEFNPLFEDLFSSLNCLEEQDGLKLEKYDIYQALMTAYSVGFNRGKKAHKPTKWLEKETEEFENYWHLYNTVKNQAIKDISGGSVARQSREFNSLVTRRMYEAGMAEEKKNWTSWDK
ncbi:hypothetical protein LLT6_13395 [Lactococcus cremoris subsp. cremoris TIFN6]|uniref:Prophage protein n=1 Tax=Lactococcus cremoris subsp. cremoris TIFN6 TaxID=1234876 RepID=T0S374_LACLC|nr:hypothetical protein LLT6_13395 [Lactococcus cremoris subsp. cremoris TIFN6]